MPSFFKLGGRIMNAAQAAAWRAQETIKNAIFCPWCISGGVRHTKDCPSVQEGFDPETTPKLTLPEREELKKQRELNKVK